MTSNYLFELIDNILLHTNSKCVLASRKTAEGPATLVSLPPVKLLKGLQLLVVAAVTFAPTLLYNRIIPEFLEF